MGDGTVADNRSRVLAATIGNALEWYDFVVFGLFLGPISAAFFPTTDKTTAILLATATFGSGFVTRPLGALLIGRWADVGGRRAALTLVMGLMCLGTALIAFTPGYATLGLAAPVAIVTGRLIQGLSAGGELGPTTAYLIEIAPAGQRRRYASFQVVGQFAAILVGLALGAAVTTLMPGSSWAWRLPFVLGLIIGPIGAYIRATAVEPGEFQRAARSGWSALAGQGKALAALFGMTVFATSSTYVLLTYMPTYASRFLGFDAASSFIAVIGGVLVGIGMSVIIGRRVDHGDPRRLALGAALVAAILAYPLLRLTSDSPTLGALLLAEIILSGLSATYAAAVIGIGAELLPAAIRSTGLSVGYNLGVVIMGGFSPFVVTLLMSRTGDALSAAYYVVAAALISAAALTLLKSPSRT